MNVKQASDQPEEQEEIRQLKHAFRMEKDADVSKRLHVIILIQRDSMDASDAAVHMCMSRSWGRKWYKRYRDEGIAGLRTRPRSGRPPKARRSSMKYLRRRVRRNTTCTAQDVSDQIHAVSGVRYNLSYVRKIIKKWGYVLKEPVLRHVRRASNRAIRRFQRKVQKKIDVAEREGYTVCVQDETIVLAEPRLAKIYTLKESRAVYVYTGNHKKVIVFGLITAGHAGYFEQHEKFTKDEFVSFLKGACKELGKIMMILDRASQHRAKIVLEAVKELDGQVILKYLPAGCPDLNAIEELWRQMKMAVLVGPIIKFDKMCKDIDHWLEHHLPELDIYNYLYRTI